jgi:phage shock protein PspC (stress-responsive transcriptional regulator)
MTDTSTPEAPPRRLTRSSSNRMIGGVCGGLAEYTGIDPVIFRVVVAVATVMGGTGLLAYAVAWLVIPKEGEVSHAETFVDRRRHAGWRVGGLPRWASVLLGVVVLLTVMSWFDGDGPFFHGGFWLLVVGGIGVWLWQRGEDDHRMAPLPPQPAAVGAPPAPPLPPIPAAPVRRRERSMLGGLTLSAALIVAGVLAAIDAGGGDLEPGAVFAAALITVGAGLLVGSRWGRARLLVPVGVVLVLATAVATVADVPFTGGAGERTWQPTTSGELQSSYRLGVGHGRLDLRDLDLDGDTRRITASVGFGHLEVWLPDGDVDVTLQAHVGGGHIDGLGDDDDGGADVSRRYERPASVAGDDGTIVLETKVGFGRVEVHQ